MVKKSKGDLSKRVTLRKKYSILRHVRDHRRDVRRAMKRNKAPKRRKLFADETAILHLPNKNSRKEDLLKSILEHREKKQSGAYANTAENASEPCAPNAIEGSETVQEAEISDFIVQLSNCLEVSSIVVHTADARAPLASICASTLTLWRQKGAKTVLLLHRHALLPEPVLRAWMKYFQNSEMFDHVVLNSPHSLVNLLETLRGKEETVTVSMCGLPNTGIESVREEIRTQPLHSVSAHDSSSVHASSFTTVDGIRVLFIPVTADILEQPIFGADCIFREWKDLMQGRSAHLTLCAEAILKLFPAQHITYHFKLPNETDLAPADIFKAIQARRGYRDIFQAVRDVLAEFHKGKLRWFCMPEGMEFACPNSTSTVIDESHLSTQSLLEASAQAQDEETEGEE